MRLAWLLIIAMLIVGCGKGQSAADKGSKPAADTASQPTNTLYDGLHSGLYQADSAVKKLVDAVNLAQDMQAKATGPDASALNDMIGSLNGVGSSLADETGTDLPSEEEVNKQTDKYRVRRNHLIDLLNDALHDVGDQEAIAATMATSGGQAIRKQAGQVDELLIQSIDDLQGALKELGATPGLQDAPDTGDPGQKPPSGYSGTTTG